MSRQGLLIVTVSSLALWSIIGLGVAAMIGVHAQAPAVNAFMQARSTDRRQ